MRCIRTTATAVSDVGAVMIIMDRLYSSNGEE